MAILWLFQCLLVPSCLTKQLQAEIILGRNKENKYRFCYHRYMISTQENENTFLPGNFCILGMP